MKLLFARTKVLIATVAVCGSATAYAGSADLKIVGVTITPANPQVGDTVQYRCFVNNQGPDTPASMHGYVGPDSSSGDTYTMFDHGNPEPFFTDNTGFRYFRFLNGSGQTVSTLTSGQTCYFDVYYKAVQAGTAQRLIGVTSDDSSVTDPNVGNNSTTSSVTIGGSNGGGITVPGTADPFLAGMPDGSTAKGGDTAPADSPVLVTGVTLIAGQALTFSATGSTDYNGGTPTTSPDGTFTYPSGAENGIAGTIYPINALVGVFLDDNRPDTTAAPPDSDFSTPEEANYTEIAPQLKQIFFIGDGKNSNGDAQKVIVPQGATRLFLANSDGEGWYNNSGSFSVTVSVPGATTSPTPPPKPAHGGLSATKLTVNGSSSPTAVAADSALLFAAQQTGTPAGVRLRMQATTTPGVEGSWSDLEDGGRMTYVSLFFAYVRSSKAYPKQNGVYFRAIASASGYADSVSNQVGPFDLTATKPSVGKTKLHFTGNGPLCDMYFRATESNTPSGISVRVQSTTTPDHEGSWSDLANGNGGQMTQSIKPSEFLLLVNNYPTTKGIYFRAIASAPGYADSISNIMGPFDVTSVVPPAVTVHVDNGLPGSGDGHDAENPIILAADSAGFGATVQSPNPLRLVQLQVDGNTVTEYPDQPNEGSIYFSFGYTPTLGDHVYEAVAVDNNGARTRAGSGAKYVRLVPGQSSSAKAMHVGGGSAATASVGHVYRVVNSGGNWYDANTWADENGLPGVPGENDFAIIGSSTVRCDSDVVPGYVTLAPGGRILGPGTFDVIHEITITGGSFEGSILDILFPDSVCNLFNAEDVQFSGIVLNNGTFNIHGSGGLKGADQFTNNGTVNFLPALQVPPDAGIDPAAALRILQANAVSNSGLLTGNITALIGQDGSSIISTDGSSLISQGGGNLIGNAGGTLISQDGSSLISQDGSSLISQDGSSLIAAGGGNFGPGSNPRAKAATAPAGYTQNGGETKLGACNIVGPVILNGGTLSGTGIIQGDLTNNGGFIAPGHSAGMVGVTGNFTQGPNGTTVIEAGGGSGGQFDVLQVAGTASLGGKLDLKLINGYKPDPADTFNPIGYASQTGSFASVSSNGQVSVNSTGVIATVNAAAPQPSPAKLLNISTRMSVQTGENVLIGGFIVTGPAGSTKKVMIRGLGPSLAQQGVPNTLPDPLLELHGGDGGIVTTNDDWQQGDTTQIPDGFGPASPKESVIVATLTVGSGGFSNYTAVMKDANGGTGVGLCEVYDLEQNSSAQLANISTRGQVQTGDNVMIGGVIVGGSEPARVLVRAVGPSLQQQGVSSALADTTLELHDANGAVLSNDDWRQTQESEIKASTIPPSSDRESAVIATLAPGNYTAIVRGKSNTTGVGLVEAYNLQ